MASLKLELERMMKEVDRLGKALDESKQENEVLQAKVVKYETELESAQKHGSSLEARNAELESSNNLLQTTNTTLTQAISLLAGEKESLRLSKAQLSTQLERSQAAERSMIEKHDQLVREHARVSTEHRELVTIKVHCFLSLSLSLSLSHTQRHYDKHSPDS